MLTEDASFPQALHILASPGYVHSLFVSSENVRFPDAETCKKSLQSSPRALFRTSGLDIHSGSLTTALPLRLRQIDEPSTSYLSCKASQSSRAGCKLSLPEHVR